jgi:hypothetical protein
MEDARMIYRCVFKGNEDYSSLEQLANDEGTWVVTIFPDGVDNAPSDLSTYQLKIDEVLFDSDERDLILFNGPCWLVALVGHAWYANEDRKHHNVLVYDKESNKYKRLTLGAIDDY